MLDGLWRRLGLDLIGGSDRLPSLKRAELRGRISTMPAVERGRQDLKSVLDLRPVCHRLEERIRAPIILCRLALPLVRVAETTGHT